MYLLTLYAKSDTSRPLASRVVASEGLVRVGRDPGCDWVIEDPECRISRNHLEFHLSEGSLSLRALGANGVFVGDPPEKVPEDTNIAIGSGDLVRLGDFTIEVSAADPTSAAPVGNEKKPGIEGPDERSTSSNRSLFEAFCEGAQIDPSHFIAEDPLELMREAGSAYREMIQGLNDLLKERSGARTRFGMDRTTIGLRDNNLLKWAPPQRLAIDLLIKKDSSFLSGANAVRAAVEDIKGHLVSVMAGYRYSLRALLTFLNPSEMAAQASRRAFWDRSSGAWERFVAIHADLEQQITDDSEGVIGRAFAEGYDRSMRDLSKRAA